MSYLILSYSGTELCSVLGELEKSVQKFLQSGWRLQGGVSISMVGSSFYAAAQAIVK